MPEFSPAAPLNPALLRQASGLYARAFWADPLMAHYLPDPALRTQVLPTFMRLALRYCLAHGEVWAAPDPQNPLALAGLACWLPPGHTALGTWGMIQASLGVVSLRQAWTILRSFAGNRAASDRPRASFLSQVSSAQTQIDRIHRSVAPGPHWYLMILGVEPAHQGQGIGTRLIAPQLARAHSAGLPCYLETMTERDVAFYQKNGFTVAHHAELFPGLHVWGMIK